MTLAILCETEPLEGAEKETGADLKERLGVEDELDDLQEAFFVSQDETEERDDVEIPDWFPEYLWYRHYTGTIECNGEV